MTLIYRYFMCIVRRRDYFWKLNKLIYGQKDESSGKKINNNKNNVYKSKMGGK
jgi:hypothetical protein